MMRLWLIVLGVLVLAPTAALAKPTSYGIAIGYNLSPEGTALPTLHYADDDAVRFFRHFRRLTDDAALLAILDDDTFKRYPELRTAIRAPTWIELDATVRRFAAKMKEDRARGDEPTFYFAYSGHGSANARGAIFLTLADAELTQDKLYEEILAKLPFSFAHLFVDACHAEAVVGARGGEQRIFGKGESTAKSVKLDQHELAALADAQRLQRFPSVGAVIATTVDQEAHEWSRLQSGVFTHEVLSGLAGAADTNNDGAIEYSELQAFVMSANRAIADPRAAPRIVAAPPAVNRRVPIVNLSAFRDVAAIAGTANALGHFYIELQNGERYLDANLGGDTLRRLILPKERVLFVRTDEHEAEIATFDKGVIRFSELRLKPLQATAKGSIDEAYRTALFASPYTASYYQGVVDSVGLPGVEMGETKRDLDRSPTELADLPTFPKKRAPAPKPGARTDRWIGLQVTGAIDALGAVGLTSVLFQHVQVAVLFDALSVGFNFEARGLFLKASWSPYVSLGGKLNIPRPQPQAVPFFFQATHFNLGVGVQYFNENGFYINLGIVWIPPFPDFVKLTQSSYFAVPLPHVSLGWAFKLGG